MTKSGRLTNLLSGLGLLPKPKPSSEPAQDPFPYRLRPDLLTPAEIAFYKVIRPMMGEHFVICPKVALHDLVFVSHPERNHDAPARIDRKHVDFLVCDPQTFKPRFAIELADPAHPHPNQAEEDAFIDALFFAAGLPLVRIQAQPSYNPGILGEKFRQALNIKKYRPPAVSTSPGKPPPLAPPDENAPDPAPVCPNCGAEMVLRTNTRGPNAGTQYYGCPNYPACRETLPLS